MRKTIRRVGLAPNIHSLLNAEEHVYMIVTRIKAVKTYEAGLHYDSSFSSTTPTIHQI